jgi:hypothetical protein
MLSFHEILAQKMKPKTQEVCDFADESSSSPSQEALFSTELTRGLLTFKLESPRKNGVLPSQAHLYRRKSEDIEMMRRKKFAEIWAQQSPLHSKYYGVFAELGEWDFSPSDKTALKKRFRKLLRRTHPDVNRSPDAHESTQKLLEAFNFLHS